MNHILGKPELAAERASTEDLANRPPAHVSWSLSVTRLASGDWLFQNPHDASAAPIIASADYRRLRVCAEADTAALLDRPSDLLRVPLECGFVARGILSLHASCVIQGEKAICFTGDSGMGKSTRAKAWVDKLGARFLSGDRPAIRLEEDGCTACGVPWDGKEQIFSDEECPLHAILEVRRSTSAHIRKLSPDQAYPVLIRQAFIPMWDPDTAALAMMNVRALSRKIPIYRSFCGPKSEDAQAIYRILFEHPEEIQEERPEMNIKKGFTLRRVAGEYLVLPTGENIRTFDGAVVLNEVSAFIWDQMQQPIAKEDLLALIRDEYEVTEETAAEDLDALLEQFRQYGMLEE